MNIIQFVPQKGLPLSLTLGKFLEREIKQRGVSISEFGRLVGVSHQTISKYMEYPQNGANYPAFDFLVKLARATNTDIGTLAGLVAPDVAQLSARARIAAERIDTYGEEVADMLDAFLVAVTAKGIKKDD